MMSSSHAATDEIVGETSEISIASTIELNDGKLSVSLKGIPLHRVITEVSRQTGIDIQFIGERPSSKVNRQFDDSPVENSLRLLLRDVNTIFVYADTVEGESSGGQLTKVFILPEGENGNLNDGIKQLVETLPGISEQFKNAIPLSDNDARALFPINGNLTGLGLDEPRL